LEVKPFEKITILELTERAGVGRATFYRNFDRVEDVLRQQSADCFTIFKEEIAQGQRTTNQDKLVHFFTFWQRHSPLIESLAMANRQDIFNQALDQLNKQELAAMVAIDHMTDDQQAYFLTMVRSMLTAILMTWIDRGRQETPEQLAEHFETPFKLYIELENQGQIHLA